MFTETEEEENGLISVIAPICFSTVVNISESTAEIRPVNRCPCCAPPHQSASQAFDTPDRHSHDRSHMKNFTQKQQLLLRRIMVVFYGEKAASHLNQ